MCGMDQNQILSMPGTRLVGLCSSLWSFLLQRSHTQQWWGAQCVLVAPTLVFYLVGSAEQFFHNPSACRLNCQRWLDLRVCLTLNESYFYDSLALMTFQKPLIHLSWTVLPPLQICHTQAVCFRMLHDSLMACLQIIKFSPLGSSWLKSSKFASSLQTLDDLEVLQTSAVHLTIKWGGQKAYGVSWAPREG